MYRFSYKVNKRCRIRKIKRQFVRHLIARDNNSSANKFSGNYLLNVFGSKPLNKSGRIY